MLFLSEKTSTSREECEMFEMRKLIFGEGLMAPSLDGEKRFTVRRFREDVHDLKKGEVFIGEFKDGLNILLQAPKDAKISSFKNLKLPKRDLDKNGYYFDKKYFEELGAYYPNLSWDEMGAIVFFEILKVNGIPVVSINEYAKQ